MKCPDCGSDYIRHNNAIVILEEGFVYTCGECGYKFGGGIKKFTITWATEDSPVYSADGNNLQYEVVESLEKFSRVYRDEVKEVILKFEKIAKVGDALHLEDYNYVAAPVVRRIE